MAKKIKEMSPLQRYIKRAHTNGRLFAEKFGVSPVTVYRQCKEPQGAYKAIEELYTAFEQKEEEYEMLVQSYNALAKLVESRKPAEVTVKEMLGK